MLAIYLYQILQYSTTDLAIAHMTMIGLTIGFGGWRHTLLEALLVAY